MFKFEMYFSGKVDCTSASILVVLDNLCPSELYTRAFPPASITTKYFISPTVFPV